MELPSEATGIFSVKPPRLEDAGLEDTALSAEGIQEAFRVAAQKVKTAAAGVLENIGIKDDEKGCTEAPSPGYTQWEDIQGEQGAGAKQGSCVETKTGGLIEEGKDAVVDPSGAFEDRVLTGEETGPRLGESGCVKDGDGAEGKELGKEKENKKKKNDDAPGLTEAAI